jgi:radical SAM protein with 4Fe4S-binding SPASM domain
MQLNILVTRRCNRVCDFCYVDATRDPVGPCAPPAPELTPVQWVGLLQQFRVLGYTDLHIYGGEPFIYAGLREVCQTARSLGYGVSVATNGTLLSGHADWVTDLGVALSVTFGNPETASLPSGAIWAHPVVDAIRSMAQRGIPVTVTACVTEQSLPDLPGCWQAVHQAVAGVGFFAIYYSPLGRGAAHPERLPSLAEWRRLERELGARDLPAAWEPTFLGVNDLSEVLGGGGCPLENSGFITLDERGVAYPCPLMAGARWGGVGEARHLGATSVVHRVQRYWNERRRPIAPKCHYCEHYNECRGGCPALVQAGAGEDPRCPGDAQIPLLCPLKVLLL